MRIDFPFTTTTCPRPPLTRHHQSHLYKPVWRRRRRRRLLEKSNTILVSSQLLEDNNLLLVSQFPYLNLLALGLAASGGVAALYRSLGPYTHSEDDDVVVGEWVLFTSPTPFNRFVILRSPSLSLQGSELLEEANEKLVKEDRHFVRLDTERIQARNSDDAAVEKLMYQRVCVSTDDGGVISLDWPATLELAEQNGLDTTLVVIPGSAQGSMDVDIRSFVCESLRRGFFPVIMNPRGCAGSPLTTARLFTAADSDDICTAVQFITNARPWTTMMGVGWGYGANMLTKYLAEVGEGTPLTAATCIDNPFDLDEATRSSPHKTVLDKLTAGLVDILRSNKELFQGRAKGFDVETALSAKSVRDFEKAISMVSYGFDAIEDFYEESSTRCVVGEVKIPVLFIQNADGGVPLFSVPRNVIAENPYTSLLSCSCSSSGIASGKPAMCWCHHLTIEWLAAVELGLLKGRHPLLMDIDFSLNPSKDSANVIARGSNRRGRVKKLNLSQSVFLNGYETYSLGKVVGESDTSMRISPKLMHNSQTFSESNNKELQQESNSPSGKDRSVDAELVKEEVGSENERGQMLQTAEVVMNMLDTSMPDTLSEEQKKKVLTAVSRGETVVKALQDVMPEDVRGKLTTAVSEFLRSEGANLKINKLLNINKKRNAAIGNKSKVYENVGTSSAGEHGNPHYPDPREGVDAAVSDSSSNEVDIDKHSKELEPDSSGQSQKVGASVIEQHEVDQNGGETKLELKEDNNLQTDINPSTDQHKMVPSTKADEGISHAMSFPERIATPSIDQKTQSIETVTNPSTDQQKEVPSIKSDEGGSQTLPSSEAQAMEKEGSDIVKSNERSLNSVQSQDSQDVPIFKVSEALDALTGMDDSTQVAVNSVFGVLEDMITQFEEKESETKVDNTKELESTSQVSHIADSYKVTGKQEKRKEHSLKSDEVDDFLSHSGIESGKDTRSEDNVFPQRANNIRQFYDPPLYINSNPFSKALYREYLRKHLLLKMQRNKSQDLNTTSALFLDYFPEEGQWKLPEHSEATKSCTAAGTITDQSPTNSPSIANKGEVIEPSYVILDSDEKQESILGYDSSVDVNEMKELMASLKNTILDALKVEVGRRLSATKTVDRKKLTWDMEKVADDVSLAACYSKNHNFFLKGTLDEKEIVDAISLAIQKTDYLRKLLPLGVIVGSTLAALRKFVDATVTDCSDRSEAMVLDQIDHSEERNFGTQGNIENNQAPYREIDHKYNNSRSTDDMKDETKSESLNNGTVMVGALTAALGASSLITQEEVSSKNNETAGAFSKAFGKQEDGHDPDKLDEEKSQNNMVTSLAEKAMSVASPMVPMKEDGEVDQEKLVAMLAELGQKGGPLRLVGKIALLWGGMRGAMSLIDRLILFLRISERPLFQRILAFVCMVLVLWSPIVVPLLPTLVQSWGMNNYRKIPQLVCIVGLYASIMILVMLWGKRIRGYENPFEQYGLDITSSSKFPHFMMGLVGGVLLVLSVHSVNIYLGCVSMSWPSIFISNSSDAVTRLKVFSKLLLLVSQGIITATGVSLVEEVLFRSWLPDEIAADFGHNYGIIFSGLAFSLLQRSLLAIPGLWLLSLVLAGAKSKSQGSLSVPIGLSAGIMATSFVLQTGGFLTYRPNFPVWVAGYHPFRPFSGVVGLTFTLVLAIVLYPMQPLHKENKRREIRE